MRIAAIGIDHRHVFGMAANLTDVGATFAAWWTDGEPGTLDGFVERFPDVPRVATRAVILDDPEIDLVVIACVPEDRADVAIAAMEAGKDVLVDKPGCTTLEQLSRIRACVERTARTWSVDFSERFEVPAVTRAAELVQAGAIGRVVQTCGLGPHRLNAASRPAWFFERARHGGILTDIGSHQIDQFLYFTGSTDAEITRAAARNVAHPEYPQLQDFGEIALESEHGFGYVRVDWFTPDALPNWGDGRLTILGTEGYIELRKYVDVGGPDGTDHLVLVNADRCERVQCVDAGLPFFARLASDVATRGESAMPQAHAFLTTELAIRAQAMAEGA